MSDTDSTDLYGGELAPWFHLLTPPCDYADDAGSALGMSREHVSAPAEARWPRPSAVTPYSR
jgi:hypothetical protein